MAASACIFCRISRGDVPSEQLHDDADVVIIRDIAPLAPIHLLVIPKEHIGSLNEVKEEHSRLLGHMMLLAVNEATRQGLDTRGYRLVMNCGPDAGQGVNHLHLHLLGGRGLGPIA